MGLGNFKNEINSSKKIISSYRRFGYNKESDEKVRGDVNNEIVQTFGRDCGRSAY